MELETLEITDIGNTNIVYNIIDIEVDRYKRLREDNQDLYFKLPHSGEFVKIAEAYDKSIEGKCKELLRRKRMSFFMTFVNTFDLEDELTPLALKVIRFFARNMSYGNVIKGYGFSDLQIELKTSGRYLTKSINQLLEKDVLRFKVVKNQRIYMVNPVYYFKGTSYGIFKTQGNYRKFPKKTKSE